MLYAAAQDVRAAQNHRKIIGANLYAYTRICGLYGTRFVLRLGVIETRTVQVVLYFFFSVTVNVCVYIIILHVLSFSTVKIETFTKLVRYTRSKLKYIIILHEFRFTTFFLHRVYYPYPLYCMIYVRACGVLSVMCALRCEIVTICVRLTSYNIMWFRQLSFDRNACSCVLSDNRTFMEF